MSTTIIRNATIVNEGKSFRGNVLIQNERIAKITTEEIRDHADQVIDASHLHLLPGCIDDQVHFREPGLTQKGTIATESKAAVAGGITSFMEMPNTLPNTLTQQLLENKYEIASNDSLANYSFFMGASNDNLEEVLKTNPENVCGIKIFMGSSTGNMLVDNRETLEAIFSKSKLLIAVHCEDEATIRKNLEHYKQLYGENIPIECHPKIRDVEACFKSSSLAVELATKYNTRLHILHISTQKEIGLFDNNKPLHEKHITAEACIHHLWFSDKDYASKGNKIKWNPSIKSETDRQAILNAVLSNKIDVIATDHAPHTIEEKSQTYLKAPSGGPLVQHALVAMLELHKQGLISLETIVDKMSHSVATCFRIKERGYIREGYYADLVLVDLNKKFTVDKASLLYKCGWSPFENQEFHATVTHTMVNGHIAYSNGKFDEHLKGKRLLFNR